MRTGAAMDRDFEVLTPSGRVVLEAEYDESFTTAQLLVTVARTE